MISRNADRDEERVVLWASRLRRWGVGDFVPLAVEVLRPFTFLGAQALHLFAPVLTTFAAPAEISGLADLLESPQALDRLSERFALPGKGQGSDSREVAPAEPDEEART